MGGKRRIDPPRGLVVEEFTADGEQFLAFSWEAGSASPAELAAAELTAAERDVLERIVRGDSNAAIARSRQSSDRTVANQVASLLRKTGAASRFELIRRFSGSAT